MSDSWRLSISDKVYYPAFIESPFGRIIRFWGSLGGADMTELLWAILAVLILNCLLLGQILSRVGSVYERLNAILNLMADAAAKYFHGE